MRIKIQGVEISSPFGATEPFRSVPHTGIDIPLKENTVLQAVQDGIVSKVYDGSGTLGKGIAIQTNDGTTHIYGHLNGIGVQPGETVHAGDIIGISGNTGNSTGPHLHFATKAPSGEYVDPTHLVGAFANKSANNSGNWFLDKYNDFADWFVGAEVEFILKPIGHFLNEIGTSTWNWFIFNLPDIMGYGTILAGICIIIGAMIGKSGMIKPLAVYAIALIISLCILGGV